MPDQDVKKTTSGGGILALFGLPFLGMGLLFVYLFLAQPEGMTTSGEPWVGALVGGVFAFLGACLVFGRSGTILDRNTRTVTTWWGLLVPFSSTQHTVSSEAHLTLTREIRSTKNGSYSVFPVRLRGGNLKISFGEWQNFDESRRKAEDVAKFFLLPIHDSTGSEEVIRPAGLLDESVQARARRLGISTPLPGQPMQCACTIQYGGPRATSVIEVPPPGIGSGHLVGLAGTVIFAGFVLYQFFGDELQDGLLSIEWVTAGFMALFFAFVVGSVLYKMMRDATSRQRITVSPAGVQIRTQGAFGTTTINFTGAEIEEVETTGIKTDDPSAVTELLISNYGNMTPRQKEQIQKHVPRVIGAKSLRGLISPDAGSVVIRTDRASVELGAALARAEKEWLRNVILHILTSEVTSTSAKPAPASPRPTPIPRELPRAVPDYSMQPGNVRRKSGGGWAISGIGIAALIFILYRNGLLTDLLPGNIVEPAAPPESSQSTQSATDAAAFAETDRVLQQSLASAEQTYGPDHPSVATVLYRMGASYRTNNRPDEQERTWLRALKILQAVPNQALSVPDGGIDKELIARELGDFYWEQYRYDDAYFHYNLAYKLADEVQIDDAERNRRLASNSAGIMATACYLGKWEIADYAMAELKDRMQTVSPEEKQRLDYWVQTGEPRLKNRKC